MRADVLIIGSGRLGVRAGDVRVDLSAVVDRKNAIVRQWRDGVRRRLERAGDRLTLVGGHARFVAERTIEVLGERWSAETIIINVGARPVVPGIPGLEEVPWLDNASVMELRDVPRHLVVLGGGYIGCEFGQMFRRFGAEVTIIDRGDHLLDREDAQVSEALEEGRRPNTDDLRCDAAGIELDERGFVVVDERYRTSAEGVYAVGDVTGGPQFTHTSWDDHRILFDLLRGRGNRTRKDRIIPFTVFTDPQLARVGRTEKEAKAEGIPYEVASMPFGHIARAIEVDEPAGTMRVLIDPGTERVLGAAIVGAEAGELIHIFAVLMQAQASARAIVDVEAVHPTFAEGVQSLVRRLDRYSDA